MSLFQALLTDSGIPPVPASYDVSEFNITGTARANIALRQTALEPSVAGVDKPYSWSCWLRVSNIGTAIQRIFSNSLTAAGTFQYTLTIREQTSAASVNQKLQFALFTDGSNAINIFSSKKFLKQRWTHVVITYDGSETAAGLKMYLNGVEDTAANKTTSGTYTGAFNNSSLRVQLGHIFTTNRLRGNLRDMCCWNAELSSADVSELYVNTADPGHPIDVTSVSFYATDIAAYWPLHTDFTSPQSANYTFGTVTGITFGSRPLSSLYPSFSVQNARIGNTRYIAFGTVLKNGNKINGWIGSGTSHVVDTPIDKFVFDTSNISVDTPVTWTDNVLNDLPDGLRGAQVGNVNGDLFLFTSQYDDVGLAFNDFGRYVATDGIVGEAFGAFTSMELPDTGESINAYGNCIAGDDAGEYFVAYHEYTVASQTISVWHTTDNGANWSKVSCFTGDSTKGYNEPCIIKVGVDTYVMLVREQAGACISCSVTTDNFATCSTPVNTGLSTGTGMAAMCLDDDGNIVAIYADRGDGYVKISLANVVADVLADPTDWNAGSSVFKTIDETNNILGYPFIVNMGSGFFAAGWSSEQNPPSATRTDFFVGYGAFGAG